MKQYFFVAALSASLIIIAMSFASKGTDHADKHLEIVLRNIGHQVLLHSNDSTSRVMPIKIINENTFQISFENSFAFNPDTLMNLVHQQLAKTARPGDYAVSVNECDQQQTIFAYEVNRTSGDLTPCSGREQKKGCYVIEISFLIKKSSDYRWLLFALIPVIFGVLYFVGKKNSNSGSQELIEERVDESLSAKAHQSALPDEMLEERIDESLSAKAHQSGLPDEFLEKKVDESLSAEVHQSASPDEFLEKKGDESLPGKALSTPVIADYKKLGSFLFFESAGNLRLNGQTIALSGNEVKALSILTSNQNQVVERNLLMKKIWEDDGVLVITRNVDVLISKLRKRLSADPSVKIMTVHGKGYKMMV